MGQLPGEQLRIRELFAKSHQKESSQAGEKVARYTPLAGFTYGRHQTSGSKKDLFYSVRIDMSNYPPVVSHCLAVVFTPFLLVKLSKYKMQFASPTGAKMVKHFSNREMVRLINQFICPILRT